MSVTNKGKCDCVKRRLKSACHWHQIPRHADVSARLMMHGTFNAFSSFTNCHGSQSWSLSHLAAMFLRCWCTRDMPSDGSNTASWQILIGHWPFPGASFLKWRHDWLTRQGCRAREAGREAKKRICVLHMCISSVAADRCATRTP
jgi:hypothetical protein